MYVCAGTTEQSIITTRARAQKLNNVNNDTIELVEKIKQSQRKKKTSSNVEGNSKTSTRQSVEKESPINIVVGKSVRKKTSCRRYKLNKKEAQNIVAECENKNVDFNKSTKALEDGHSDNILSTKSIENGPTHFNNTKSLDLSKMPQQLRQEIDVADVTVLTVMTPKSTPIKFNLTPDRSTKTPKRSPISLGSPKTHTETMPKLKTPRRLSLTPEKSNKSHKDAQEKEEKLQKRKRDGSPNKSDVNLKKNLYKFLKSPKIVLKSPKSKKSKSPKLKLSLQSKSKRTSKNSLTTTMPDLNTTKPLRIDTENTPSSKSGDLSMIKYPLLNPRLMNTLTVSQIKDTAEPVVLLERLSSNTILTTVSKNQSDILINERKNSKSLTPATRTKKSDTSVHLKANHQNPVNLSSSNMLSPNIKHDTSIQGRKRKSSMPRTSTPQEKPSSIQINLSPTSIVSDDESPNTRLRNINQSSTRAMQFLNALDQTITIESVSKPSPLNKDISGVNQIASSFSKQNVTFDINEDIILEKDVTYELKQPQTLSLQQIAKKHIKKNANLSTQKDNKKTHKVHFANFAPDKSCINKSSDKPIRLQSFVPRKNNAEKNSIINLNCKSEKLKTVKLTQGSLATPLKTKSSSTIHGVAPKVQLPKTPSLNIMSPSFSASLNRIAITPKTCALTEKKSGKIKINIFVLYIYSMTHSYVIIT